MLVIKSTTFLTGVTVAIALLWLTALSPVEHYFTYLPEFFLPQALILNNIIKYLEHYFTYLPEFFSPFIHNTQI